MIHPNLNYFFKNKEKHQFHLVDNSQLPLITSIGAMLLVMSFVFYFHPTEGIFLHNYDNLFFHSGWMGFSVVLFAWFLIVVKESGQGHHTWVVRHGLRFGMALFIVSEVMFFFAFFWAFFHVSLSPSISVGSIWPPKSIQSLDVWGLPLVNTILLLSSGVAITFAHRALFKYVNMTASNFFAKHLFVTVIFGTVFLFCQMIEYKYGITFRWKESVYGTTFFVTTGFHGLHVTIGTIFLLFCLVRAVITAIRWSYSEINNWLVIGTNSNLSKEINKFFGTKIIFEKEVLVKDIDTTQEDVGKFSFTKNQHLGFEAAAWYWHFVDVVWIFLFMTVYWWGSS